MRRLAKVAAALADETMALYRNEDGTYGFAPESETDKPIIEYISPY